MRTGKGTLVLSGGRSLPLRYEFGSDVDDTRAGYLFCDISGLDPALLFDRLHVRCDDGTKVVASVMHFGDRYLAVIGRVVEPTN